MRAVLLPVAAAVTMSATAAMADNKSECQKGIAMIKAELKEETLTPQRASEMTSDADPPRS
jgi:hypothetical protein